MSGICATVGLRGEPWLSWSIFFLTLDAGGASGFGEEGGEGAGGLGL